MIHTLPAVARLKAAWPSTRIAWLINPEWAPLLEGNPDVEEIVVFPRRAFRGFAGWAKISPWLRANILSREPDIVVDFQGLLRTALIGRLSRARDFYGMSDAREGARWFYKHVAAIPPEPAHAIERSLALADEVIRERGAALSEIRDQPLCFPLPPGEPVNHEKIPDEFILLHPFSRGSGKSLSDENVSALCRGLPPGRVVIVGQRDLPFPGQIGAATNLLNRTTLPQLIWLMRRAAFVITVDSGPAHLAAALGRPMVAIHTWSDPRRVGPYRPDAWVWKNGRCLRVRDLPLQPERFFTSAPAEIAYGDIDAICALATSP